jgi:glutathione S-transferase
MATAITKQPIIIYAFPGSQFVHKVLAAIESRSLTVPVYVYFVSITNLDDRRNELPSGGTLVPEMKVGTGDESVVVSDSENILHWLDDNHGTSFFPTEKASELSQRASNNTLAGMVWYYNYVDKVGYQRSLQRRFREKSYLVYFPEFVSNAIINYLIKSQVQKKTESIIKAIPGANVALLDEGPTMRRKLIEELKYFQDFFKTSEQKFILPDSNQPTAADFSVYAQVARLLAGGTSDSEVPAATPELRDNRSLDTLWKWYDSMKENYYVKVKGRRPPKELL